MASCMLGKRALSPESSVETVDSKRIKQTGLPYVETVYEGMEVDDMMEAVEDNPLAPPDMHLFGNASRDGNESLADALALDAQTYSVPPSSPENAASIPAETDMETEDVNLETSNTSWPSYSVGSHYGAHPLSSLPESHPLRAQPSIDTLSTESSAGPATPADDSFDYDEEFPCYAWAKDSTGVPRPFAVLVGHGHA